MTSTFSQPHSFSQSSSGSRNTSRRLSNKNGSNARAAAFGSCEKTASWVDNWSVPRGSLSTSFQRAVASSPTESGPTSTSGSPIHCSPSPSQVVLGFDVPSHQNSEIQLKPVSANIGLLSQAFVPRQDDFLLSPVAESSSMPQFNSNSSSAFFPEVDLSLLLQAQEMYDVFKTELISNAFMLASRAYAGDMRKDGSTQLSHCLLAAMSLADLGLDANTIAAALLHESLRHNDGLRSQLEEFMPTEVVQMVDHVTTISEISQLYRNHRDEVNDEKLRRMMLAMEDVRAVLVKLACRVHNMKTLSALSPAKQKLFAQETLDIFAVVANRLGCWCLKAELEDLAFAVLHPEEYQCVRAMVGSRQDAAALEGTVQAIKAGLDEWGIKYEDISGRPKNLYGIWQKMLKDGVTNVDKIYDVIALRVVVCGNKHDCYQAQRVVQGLYRCMHERSKDFIRVTKKANGYQSLHDTIYGEDDLPVEVQIRTSKMHYIAEYGFAAHWKYKESGGTEVEAPPDDWLDKEVQYKKWLMSYGLGVHDKKVRPSGSPLTDCSLKSLGAAYLQPAARSASQAPSAAHDRVDPFLRHNRFRLQQPAPRSIVTVVLQTQDNVAPLEVAAGMTVQQLTAELNVQALPGFVLTINQRLAGERPVALRDGDLVQVLPLAQVQARSPPESRRRTSGLPPLASCSSLPWSGDRVMSHALSGMFPNVASCDNIAAAAGGAAAAAGLEVFSLHAEPVIMPFITPGAHHVAMASPVPIGGR